MDRNPYVMLGVPFGASRDQATLAFTARAKRLRRDPDGAGALTDLTWALNQITDVVKDPSLLINVYRVPADMGALEPQGNGVFSPLPERMARQTGPSEADRQKLTAAAGREALTTIYQLVAGRSQLPAR